MNTYPDISKAKISLASSLSQRKIRKKENKFVVEGRKSVSDTLDHYELEYIAALPEWIEENSGLCEQIAGKIYVADATDMRKISSLTTPPDVVAIYKLPEATSTEELMTSPLKEDLYLMLDSIQDPGNLGTIIRTAHWFGIKRIFASPMTADVYNPKTVQSSMGSISAVSVDYIDLHFIVSRNRNLPVIGLQLEGDNIYTTPLPTSGFIVMGNEGNGLSPSMMNELDIKLTIPPYNPSNHPESLNVAVATAITLSQFRSRT
ncbi:MAG: RNA methyltransferase [Muribaculaceae bacterium]|nr:RNA methyltransferase [Muribaculaceae bacterium]